MLPRQAAVISLITLVVVAYVFMPPVLRPDLLKQFEYLAYDIRMKYASQPDVIDTQVVVVDIDDDSQQEFGRWPWPRDLTARLIETLGGYYQVSSMGLDVNFSAPVYNSQQADNVLAAVLKKYSPVMALKLVPQTDKPKLSKPVRIGTTGTGVSIYNNPPPQQPIATAIGYIGNLPQFMDEQRIVGHIAPLEDVDTKNRRLNTLYRLDKRYFSTLSLAMWRESLGGDGLVWNPQLEHWLDSPKWQITVAGQPSPFYLPVNEQGEVLIPYQTRPQTVSAAKVLNKFYAPEDLQGKIVLLGSSAEAQGNDLVATPLNPRLPGVEIHAVMLSAMLAHQLGENAFKIQPTNEVWLQLMVLLSMALTLFMARRLGVSGMLLAGPLLLGLWTASNYWLWSVKNIAIDFLPPALLIVTVMIYGIIADLLEINARHQHVRRMFGFYLPEPVVQRLANDRSGTDWLKAERKDMTVLFADIQGFTTMADSMSPEAITEITYQLFSGLTEVIHNNGGTVDKYMGDAVMAFWGAPLPDHEHALHAVKGAVAMQQAVIRMNENLFKAKNITIRLGIGINSGPMVVGNLGSEHRHAYTVMGATVNMASAIQQLTREYRYDILLGEATAGQLAGHMITDLGLATSKKFTYKIKVFAVNKDVMQ